MKKSFTLIGSLLLGLTIASCSLLQDGKQPVVATATASLALPDRLGPGRNGTRLAEPGTSQTRPTDLPWDSIPAAPPAPTGLNVPLRVHNRSAYERSEEPVTSGLPLPKDLGIRDASRLGLVDEAGHPVPAQFTTLARWGGAPGDTSHPIRWLLIDFQVSVPPWGENTIFLQEAGPSPDPAQRLAITAGPSALIVETHSDDGAAIRYSFDQPDGRLIAPGLAEPLTGRLWSDGVEYTTTGPVQIDVVLDGPLRASIRVHGSYRDTVGNPLLDYTSRFWFYAGQPSIRLYHTVENNTPCPLGEYEQVSCMDIGSAGSVTFDDLTLVVPTGLGDRLTYEAGGQEEVAAGTLTGDLLIVQDSSGTEYWDHYRTLFDWDGNPLDARPRIQAYVSYRGYRTQLGDAVIDSGYQAPGWLSIAGEDAAWMIGLRDFWQNFPKALRASPGGTLEVGLFPGEYGPEGYDFTLRAGEHKTHEVLFTSGVGSPPAEPLFAQAPPSWYVDSGALGRIAVADEVAWPEHEAYLRHQLETALSYEEWMDWHPSLLAAVQRTDFYGIFDYGDWPVDYEGYGVAPLNPKYHNGMGLWQQWVRTGDGRWFRLAQAASRHVADIDILHTLHSPRHWSDGIAFGHSYHDEDGFLNPHRNAGGLSPDTAWGLHGLLLAYYVTGYEKAFESALELADCIEYRVHNDVHLCSTFPDCSGEGWALGEGLYDDGSRPAANALSIAVGAYRATVDPRFLAVADAIVYWARPEDQPYLSGLTGAGNGDAAFVKPWQLNLYLRALADYLEMRDEFGLPDSYDARGAYLAYADWLRTHVWLDLEPESGGPRAAYPYQWWLDGRQGDPTDEWATGNNIPDVSNWLLLGADVMGYAHRLSGEADYLERAATLFRTGTHDPWYEGDANTYSATKETVNSIVFGHVFLYEWAHQ